MRGRSALAVATLLAGAGCASSSPGDAGPCLAPEAAELAASATLREAAGRYELTMVATSGPAAGERVVGSLELVPDGGAGNPLIGWSDLDPSELGAYVTGSLDSRDPARPGVRVFEDSRGGRASITLRLGSEANRASDVLSFDGAYTVLRVREIDEGGFRGRWESGTSEVLALGHFCAARER